MPNRDDAPVSLLRPDSGTLVARLADTPWQDAGSGFWMKPVFEDKNAGLRTLLMKVDPGTEAEPHAHDELEQIFVLEGEFHDEEETYRAGDFAVRAPGAMHTGGSRTGALVLLVYSP
ncbi:MAG: cupin domain-containing protein [Alphaproteobacteria bacterium]